MATKFPISYDDTVTLGGPFIDTLPPADSQRNIAAEFRNNMNDAMLAVQARIGYENDPATTSIDWGLLTIAGTPNQGLRFAGAHAEWPGAVGESGFFIDSVTGHVAFHEAGDAKAVFTDLIATTGSWDALYSVDKTLDINAAPLEFRQTSVADYGFKLLRNLPAASTDSPIVHIANENSLDGQPSVLIEGGASNGISKHIAQITATSAGLLGGTETLVGVKSIVEEAATDIAGAELVAFRSTVGGVAGAGTKVGFDADATLDLGLRSNSPVFLDVDVENFDPLGFGVGVGLIINDTSTVNPSVPFVILDSLSPIFVVFRSGQVEFTADASDALVITQSDTTGSILRLLGAGGGDARFAIGYEGDTLHRINPSGAIDSYELRMHSTGVGGDTVRGFFINFAGHAGDISAPIRGIDLGLAGGGGTHEARAININNGWNHGVFSAAQLTVEIESTALDHNCLIAAQNGSGLLVDLIRGDIATGTSVWTAANTGSVTHQPIAALGNFTAYDITTASNGLGSGATVRGQHIKVEGHVSDTGVTVRGLELEFVNMATSTSHGVYIDGDWDLGIYSTSSCHIDIPSGSYGLRLARADTGDQIYADGTFGGSWRLDSLNNIHHTTFLGSGFVNSGITGYNFALTSWLPSGSTERSYGIKFSNRLNATNLVGTVHYAVYAENCVNEGSGDAVGIHIGKDYTRAISTESPTVLSSSPLRIGNILTLKGGLYAGVDVLTDGDMEAVDTAAWSANPTEIDLQKSLTPRPGSTGIRSLRLQTLVSTQAEVTQNFPTHYQEVAAFGVSGWVKTSNFNEWIPAVTVGWSGAILWTGAATNDWQQFGFDTTRGEVLRLIAIPVGGATLDTLFFDDIIINEYETLPVWTADNYGRIVHELDNLQPMDINHNITHDSPINNYGLTVDMPRTMALTQNAKSVYGIVSTVYSHVDDVAPVTASPHAAFRAEFSGTIPAALLEVPKYGVSIGSGFLAGLYSEESILIESNSPLPLALLSMYCTETSNSGLISAGVGTLVSNSWRFVVTKNGIVAGQCFEGGGYALDISTHETTGAELLDDGDMELADMLAWATVGVPNYLGKDFIDPHSGLQSLTVYKTDGAAFEVGVAQTKLMIGTNYRLTFWVRSDGDVTPAVWQAPSDTILWAATETHADWREHTIDFTADGTDIVFGLRSAGGAVSTDVWYDDCSVIEIGLFADLCRFRDAGEDVQRFIVAKGGATTINGTDANFLTLYDQPSLQPRFVFNRSGEALFYSGAAATNPLLTLDTSTYIGAGPKDLPFISCKGVTEATYASNISTLNGDGAVTGPQTRSTSDGWNFTAMIKIEVNGDALWIPAYEPDRP